MVFPRNRIRTPLPVTVVRWTPLIRAMSVIGLVAAVGGAAVAGYWLGMRQSDLDRDRFGYLKERNGLLQLELESTGRQLADALLSRGVDRQALAIQREEVKTQDTAIRELREQLTFYRGLMDEPSPEQGLEVAEFELMESDGSDAFSFRLLLTRPTEKGDWISGNVKLDVTGLQAGTEAERVLSLSEITDVDAVPLEFRFRYFQRLTGSLTLPNGFRPLRVTVRLASLGENAVQLERTFPWPVTPA